MPEDQAPSPAPEGLAELPGVAVPEGCAVVFGTFIATDGRVLRLRAVGSQLSIELERRQRDTPATFDRWQSAAIRSALDAFPNVEGAA